MNRRIRINKSGIYNQHNASLFNKILQARSLPNQKPNKTNKLKSKSTKTNTTRNTKSNTPRRTKSKLDNNLKLLDKFCANFENTSNKISKEYSEVYKLIEPLINKTIETIQKVSPHKINKQEFKNTFNKLLNLLMNQMPKMPTENVGGTPPNNKMTQYRGDNPSFYNSAYKILTSNNMIYRFIIPAVNILSFMIIIWLSYLIVQNTNILISEVLGVENNKDIVDAFQQRFGEDLDIDNGDTLFNYCFTIIKTLYKVLSTSYLNNISMVISSVIQQSKTSIVEECITPVFKKEGFAKFAEGVTNLFIASKEISQCSHKLGVITMRNSLENYLFLMEKLQLTSGNKIQHLQNYAGGIKYIFSGCLSVNLTLLGYKFNSNQNYLLNDINNYEPEYSNNETSNSLIPSVVKLIKFGKSNEQPSSSYVQRTGWIKTGHKDKNLPIFTSKSS